MTNGIEKYQIFIYLGAVLGGLAAGTLFPERAAVLETVLWPALGVLLYTTFLQVPMARIREAATDGRFLAAAVTGNFVIVPLVVWALLGILPDDPAVRLGVLMVLLVPCVDWFVSFTQLGGGDTGRAIAFSPLALLLQMMLLPIYLWLFLGGDVALGLAGGRMVVAFAGLILLPLGVAALTQKWAAKDARRAARLGGAGRISIALLALVILLVAASQVDIVLGAMSLDLVGGLMAVFTLFLVGGGVIARLLARLFTLPVERGRTLAFSFGTRNSFVILPLALALPGGFELAAVVIVFQSLIELFGMIVYLWWVPQVLFPRRVREAGLPAGGAASLPSPDTLHRRQGIVERES